MQQRLIAVLILLIMLGIPGILYWIFFVKNISSVTISLENNISADVRLSGTFSYSWLPLADTILNFSQKCDTECRFENIPAANYIITIESENHLPMSENFLLQNGENLQKTYRLTRTTDLAKSEVPTPLTRDEKILRNADFAKMLWENFQVIDRDLEGKIWLSKTENSATTIGFLRDEKFVSVANLPYIFEEILLDFYENSFILRSSQGEILMMMDGENIFETKLPDGTFSVFFQEKMWHATTQEKTFFWKNGAWRENVRFSHWRDLDEIWRAGFIRADAENLLKLSNYSLEEGSVLLLLNRKTGEIFQVARGLDISRFSIIDGRIYAVQNNDFYILKIPE